MARYDADYERDRPYREREDYEREDYERDPERRAGRYDRGYNWSGGTMFDRDYHRYYGPSHAGRGPFYGRTEYESGQPREPRYRGERYYGPDYSRGGRGYERSRDGGEEEWVLPRVHRTGEPRGRFDEERDYGYGRRERPERWSRPRSFRSEEHEEGYGRRSQSGNAPPPEREAEPERWLEGDMGRIEYDDPYGRRTERYGPHTGKGPRGYEPSSERIRDEVCERLTRHSGIDASDISVNVEGFEITLTGTVDSRHTKRLAEEIADTVPSVMDVHNHLTIRRVESGTPETGSTPTSRTSGSSRAKG